MSLNSNDPGFWMWMVITLMFVSLGFSAAGLLTAAIITLFVQILCLARQLWLIARRIH